MSDTLPTDAGFISVFPEFNDPVKYPESQRAFWMDLAITALDGRRWAEYYAAGVYLWTAHHLVLFSAKRTGQGGRLGTGLLSSKAVGSVSASYDNTLAALRSGGQWNATLYGIRFLDLMYMIGSGGVQLPGGPVPSGGGGIGWGGIPPVT